MKKGKTKILILLAIAVVLVGGIYLSPTGAEQQKFVPSLSAARPANTPQVSPVAKSPGSPPTQNKLQHPSVVASRNGSLPNKMTSKKNLHHSPGIPIRSDVGKTALLSEGFEGGVVPPAGWSSIVNNPYTWELGSYSPHSGSYYAVCYYDDGYTGTQDEWLISPIINLTTKGTAWHLYFWWYMSYYWGVSPYDNYDLEVWISTDGGTTFSTMLWTEPTATFTTWQWYQADIDLAPYLTQNNVKLGFRYYGYDGAEGAFDDITVEGEQVGRCCYGDPSSPSCADNLPSQCSALSGTWTAGLNCTANPCPIAGAGENCATALVISSLPFNTTGNTCAFANDYDETCPYAGGSSPDVVYSYSPAIDQSISIDLCNSLYDTKVFVYEDACASGTAIACNDDACGSDGYKSAIYGLSVLAGHTYYIVVDGYGTSSCGDYDLTVTEAGAAPANDLCTGAPIINTFPTTVYGTTIGATIDCPGVLNWYAVWYQVDLPYASNKLTADYCPTNADIYQVGIVMYDACPMDCYSYIYSSSYQFIYCPFLDPQVWWSGLPQGSYWVPIAVWDASGSPFMDFGVTFTVEELTPPPNDNCANAIPIGDVTNLPFSTEAATFDGPGSCQTAPNVWYCYTATCNGNAQVSLCGSSYDTKLAAYDGCSCWGPMLACNDDACGGTVQSEISFPVVMGNSYLIEVGGYSTATGSGVLSTSCAIPPPNDECTGAPIINTFPQTVYGTTIGAGVDCADVLAWNAVWYRFDVPYNCNKITVDFCETVNSPSTMGIVMYNSCPPDCPNFIIASSYTWQACSNGSQNLLEYWDGLPAGSYWLPVYLGSPMDFGFTVTVDSCVPCDVVCPAGGVPEGEPTCYDGYIDEYNGGCNYTPYVFQDINCNTTICGTSGVYDAGGYREMDWYRVQAGEGTLTWKAVGEFNLAIWVIDAGSENCSDYTVLGFTSVAKCDTAVLSMYVTAGTYWLLVAPSDWGNYPCGVEYVATLECTGLGPQISVTPTSFNQSLPPGATADASMYITNTGSENLDYEIDYNPSSTWLVVSPRIGTIPPSNTETINLHFDATVVGLGTYNDVLLIANNSTKDLLDTVEVPVQLMVEYPPDIDVASQMSIGAIPGCTMEKPLKVKNLGDGPLRFTVKSQGSPPLASKHSGGTYQERVLNHIRNRNVENLSKSGAPLAAPGNNPARLSMGNSSIPGTPIQTKGDTVFTQLPMTPDEGWSFGTSDQGAGYKIYENFWDITVPIAGIQWWGLCLIYSGGFSAGDPNNLTFDITFYSDAPDDPTMPPSDVVCTYTDVVPTVIPTGLYFVGFEQYAFVVEDLGSLCDLPPGSGWVSIQSKSAGQGYDWFLWASAQTGDGYSYQEGSGDYFYDDAMILIGGTACPYTISPVADTVPPGGSTDIVLTIDGSAFTQCGTEAFTCYLVFKSNDPDEPVVTTEVDLWSGRGDVFTPYCWIDIGDVVYLINYVYKDGPAPNPICMGDCDPSHDGVIDLADIVYLIQYLFLKGAPPQSIPAIHGSSIER